MTRSPATALPASATSTRIWSATHTVARADGVRLDAVQVLAVIADLLTPCPAPEVTKGWDLCAHAQPWPCPVTRAAWLARGLDEPAQAHVALTGVMDRTACPGCRRPVDACGCVELYRDYGADGGDAAPGAADGGRAGLDDETAAGVRDDARTGPGRAVLCDRCGQPAAVASRYERRCLDCLSVVEAPAFTPITRFDGETGGVA